jgi:flavin-dependent dehydrogenase
MTTGVDTGNYSTEGSCNTPMSMYDAIVVGARCAGSPTAMLLARAGYKVLLIDQATFPSDTMSTHHIHRAGLVYARKWGLLDKLEATKAPKIQRWAFDLGPFALEGNPLPADGIDYDLCPRRTLMDKVLVDAAAEAGVDVREGVTLQELLWNEDGVCGIEATSPTGAKMKECAGIVIGADGRFSKVARLVEAQAYNDRPALACGYYAYWSGVDLDGVELYPREGMAVVAEETNDGLVYVAVGWPRAMFDHIRTHIATHHMRAVDRCAPELAEKLRRGTRETAFKGTDFPWFFRKPYGLGWALVGDAGYHRDAITGQGITDAFRSADALAGAIDAGFSGRMPLKEALEDYETRRNMQVMPMYEFSYKLAKLEAPSPEEQQLFGALRENEYEARRFLSTIAGSVAISEFFAEENVARIIRGALPAAA